MITFADVQHFADSEIRIIKKGKNYRQSSPNRKEKDLYETPVSMTRQLLEIHPFAISKTTLEPACGSGAMVRVMEEFGFLQLESYDQERNFLIETRNFDQIISN